jgi:hypothetical protein
MTVIAWDGHTLAADKRNIVGGGLALTCTKIVPWKNCLLGITGDWDTGAELREWFGAGASLEKFPASAREGKATLIVIMRNDDGHVDLLQFSNGPFPLRVEHFRHAWGSGRDFALAAMFLDHDARSAVSVACEFQSDCGNGIDILQLPPKEL